MFVFTYGLKHWVATTQTRGCERSNPRRRPRVVGPDAVSEERVDDGGALAGCRCEDFYRDLLELGVEALVNPLGGKAGEGRGVRVALPDSWAPGYEPCSPY